MTPYYSDAYVTLYHGDCREVLPSYGLLPTNSVVIADPPYAETSLAWDRWPTGWVTAIENAACSVVPLWCFGSLRTFLDRRDDFAAWRLAQDVVWEKHNGSNAHADRFRRVHEHAVQWYRGEWAEVYASPVKTADATKRTVRRKGKPPQWWGAIGDSTYTSEDGGPRLMRSVIYCRSEHGRAENETQKPVGIVLPLIEYSCPPGGLVVSPFAGAGTDLVAARQAGRRAIGVELREEQCEIAARRLSQGVLDFGGAA